LTTPPLPRSRRPHPALRARKVIAASSVAAFVAITGLLAAHNAFASTSEPQATTTSARTTTDSTTVAVAPSASAVAAAPARRVQVSSHGS
jgi:hypothetical protein